MPNVQLAGSVQDIDGQAVSVSTEGDRIRLQVGTSTAVFGMLEFEDFAQVLIAAIWATERQPRDGW